jgi:hypothetical protein
MLAAIRTSVRAIVRLMGADFGIGVSRQLRWRFI